MGDKAPVRQGPDPRRVIRIADLSPQKAEELLLALQDTIRWCDEVDEAAGAESEAAR